MINKKRFMIISVIVFVLFVAGCKSGYDKETQVKINECEKGKEIQTTGITPQMTPELKRDFCLFNVALEKSDPSICERVPSSDTLESINFRVYCKVGIAINTGDLKICEEFKGDLKDTCFVGVGSSKKNVSICEKINSLKIKNECFNGVAMKLKDISICEKMSLSEEKEKCFLWATPK